MRITEYRIMLPYSVDEIDAMSSYLMCQIKEKAKEGSEIEREYYGEAIWRRWFSVKKDNKSFNAKFTYYQDSNHLFPKWRQSMFADESNVLDVRHWLIYGSISKTLITMAAIDKFYCETYCKIRDYSKIGHDNNIFRLYEEQLAQRKIVAFSVRKAGDLINMGRVESQEVPANELHDEWVNRSLRSGSPVTCIYFLTCVDFPYKMQAYMEKYIAAKLQDNLLIYHLKNLANLGQRIQSIKADIYATKMKVEERIEELSKDRVTYDQYIAYGLEPFKMDEWMRNYRVAMRELEVKAQVTIRKNSVDSYL